MTYQAITKDSAANRLCKACGLCCTGHLFIWVKLRPAELDPAEALGMQVTRDEPSQRGFNQPCPLWRGECSIYASKHYPHACRAYKCKLFKEVDSEPTSLTAALAAVERARELISAVKPLLPPRPGPSFRERLVARYEHPEQFSELASSETEFRQKAESLLTFYHEAFGVSDLLESPFKPSQPVHSQPVCKLKKR